MKLFLSILRDFFIIILAIMFDRGAFFIGQETLLVQSEAISSRGFGLSLFNSAKSEKPYSFQRGETIADSNTQTKNNIFSRIILHESIFSPNGQFIAIANNNGTIRLRNLKHESYLDLKGHQGSVRTLSFRPDGKQLASGGDDGFINLWNQDGRLLKRFKAHLYGVTDVKFSPDGQMIASAGLDRTVKLWSLDGTELKTLRGHAYWVKSIDFSPDGQMIASAGYDSIVNRWSIRGHLLNSFEIFHSQYNSRMGNQNSVNRIKFSPNGKIIASATEDGAIRFWTLDGQELANHQGNKPWAENGLYLVEDRNISYPSIPYTYDVFSDVIFRPDGLRVASANAFGSLTLWNSDGDKLWNVQAHQDSISSLAYNPDGTMLLTTGKDGKVKLWNGDGKLLKSFPAYYFRTDSYRSFDDQSRSLAAPPKRQRQDLVQISLLKTFDLTQTQNEALSPGVEKKNRNDEHIVVISKCGSIDLWHLGQSTTGDINLKKKNRIIDRDPYIFGCSEDYEIKLSPDTTKFFLGSGNGDVKLKTLGGKILQNFTGQGEPTSVGFSSTGNKFAIANPKSIDIYSLDGSALYQYNISDIHGYSSDKLNLVFSPSEKSLMFWKYGDVYVWDLDSGRLKRLLGLTHEITSASFSPDGKVIVVHNGNRVYLWNLDGELLYSFPGYYSHAINLPGHSTLLLDGSEILSNMRLEYRWCSFGLKFVGNSKILVDDVSGEPSSNQNEFDSYTRLEVREKEGIIVEAPYSLSRLNLWTLDIPKATSQKQCKENGINPNDVYIVP